jgi:hypothetical protein
MSGAMGELLYIYLKGYGQQSSAKEGNKIAGIRRGDE